MKEFEEEKSLAEKLLISRTQSASSTNTASTSHSDFD